MLTDWQKRAMEQQKLYNQLRSYDYTIRDMAVSDARKHRHTEATVGYANMRGHILRDETPETEQKED